MPNQSELVVIDFEQAPSHTCMLFQQHRPGGA
jgi:hypothetical protein